MWMTTTSPSWPASRRACTSLTAATACRLTFASTSISLITLLSCLAAPTITESPIASTWPTAANWGGGADSTACTVGSGGDAAAGGAGGSSNGGVAVGGAGSAVALGGAASVGVIGRSAASVGSWLPLLVLSAGRKAGATKSLGN